MKIQDVKLIIVPDVHGRTFWEDVFKYDTEIVFLGDYLDPFPYEDIFPWDALDNFTHIVTFAKKNPRVHLLLGNHDLAYVKSQQMCRNRTDRANYDDIRKLFVDHQDLFSLAYDCTIGGKDFFFSHAGISAGWCEMHSEIFDRPFPETLRADYINQLYREGLLNSVLGDVGGYRHGPKKWGSMVWADIFEHAENPCDVSTDVIQIVGHTQLPSAPLLIKQHYLVYDVDIRECVCLDSQGDLHSLKTGKKYIFD